MNTEKPTVYELAENIASDEVKKSFLDFIEFCVALRMKPRLYASEKMNMKYKGKMILRFDPSCLDGNLYIFFTVGFHRELDKILSKQPADIQQFYVDNIRRCGQEECTECKPVPKGIVLNILGTNYEFCNTGMRFVNPTKEQFEYIKKFVVIRREHIKNVAG